MYILNAPVSGTVRVQTVAETPVVIILRLRFKEKRGQRKGKTRRHPYLDVSKDLLNGVR